MKVTYNLPFVSGLLAAGNLTIPMQICIMHLKPIAHKPMYDMSLYIFLALLAGIPLQSV